jgi:hypothetical protein
MIKHNQPKTPSTPERAIKSVTLNHENDNTRIPYIVIPLYLLEIENANILRLLLELIKNTRDFPRLEIYNGQVIKIPPRSGILKGGVLASKWHVDKSSVWRWVRWLEKQKLVQRTMQRYHSLYSLTNRAFPVIKWNSVQSSKEQVVNPPANPCLSINYKVNKGEKPPVSTSKKILCPKCKGEGESYQGPNRGQVVCPVCNGKKIIWREDYELLKKIKKGGG